jgi:hypothetical protein
MASSTVARSLVGPVIGWSVLENGTTIMRSRARMKPTSRRAASRTKSIRRDML